MALSKGIFFGTKLSGTTAALLTTHSTMGGEWSTKLMKRGRKKQFMKVKNSKGAFTLIEIMIVVAIIGLLAAIAVPNFVKARTQSQTNACINNLRQIDSGKEQLAMEAKLATGASVVVDSVNVYIKGGTTPVCPASGTYTYNNL